MKLNRKKTRKLLFQKLYAMSFGNFNEDLFHKSFYEGVFDFDMDTVYYNEMTNIILENEGFYLDIISQYAPKFHLSNMNIIYILPIYIALAEMFHLQEEIPAKVSINEAIEISKAFGDESAKKIVNGILNQVLSHYSTLKKGDIDKKTKQTFSFF